MNEIRRFRRALTEAATGRADPAGATATARELTGAVRAVVLVEGHSDQAALDTLAARHGRDLDAEGIAVVPLGGATNIGRFLDVCGPPGLGLPVAGLCDIGEERHFRRHLTRVGLTSCGGLEALGFFVCAADLEDELIRALGPDGVRQVIDAQGESRPFHTFQGQPAQRERPVAHQLRRFLGTHSGRKAQYAQALVAQVDLARVPRPLAGLLTHLA
ncbi:ATP-dependent endonuclease [Streptomyces sp. NPDC048290]|uniref:ATP-dependent endonuclease n=1 Tax=Streptomyces sp. NPDC048290 TaxID=3155811 RepID=UPI00343E4315